MRITCIDCEKYNGLDCPRYGKTIYGRGLGRMLNEEICDELVYRDLRVGYAKAIFDDMRKICAENIDREDPLRHFAETHIEEWWCLDGMKHDAASRCLKDREEEGDTDNA